MSKAEKTDTVTEEVQSTVEAGARAVEEGFDHLKDQARESYRKGKATVRQYEADVEQYIQDRPLKSLLIALGVGILFGFLWRRH